MTECRTQGLSLPGPVTGAMVGIVTYPTTRYLVAHGWSISGLWQAEECAARDRSSRSSFSRCHLQPAGTVSLAFRDDAKFRCRRWRTQMQFQHRSGIFGMRSLDRAQHFRIVV